MKKTLFFITLLLFCTAVSSQEYDCSTKLYNGYRGPCYINCILTEDRQYAFVSRGYQWNYQGSRDIESQRLIKKYNLETGEVVEEFKAGDIYYFQKYYRHLKDEGFPYLDKATYIAKSSYGKLALINGKAPNGQKGLQVYDFENDKTLWMNEDKLLFKYRSPLEKDYDQVFRFDKDGEYCYLNDLVIDLKKGEIVSNKYKNNRRYYKKDHNGYFIFQQSNAMEFNKNGEQIRNFQTKLPKNHGLFPVDGQKAWVFQRHHSKDFSHSIPTTDSKTAGLYLVHIKTGEILDKLIFDFSASKTKVSKADVKAEDFYFNTMVLLKEKLPELEAPKVFYDEERQVDHFNVISDEGLFFIGAGNRTLIMNLEDQTVLGVYERNVSTNSIGTSGMKVRGSFDKVFWDPSNQAYAVNTKKGVRRYNKNGKCFAKKIEEKKFFGINEKGQAISLNIATNTISLVNSMDGTLIKNIGEINPEKEDVQASEEANYYITTDLKSLRMQINYASDKKSISLNEAFQDRDLVLKENVMIDQDFNVYDPNTGKRAVGFHWRKPSESNAVNQVAGNYILSYVPEKGIEVFDIIDNEYITNVPVFVDAFGLKFPNISKMAYFDSLRAILVVSGREGLYTSDINNLNASAYSVNIDTKEMRPYLFNGNLTKEYQDEAKKNIFLVAAGEIKKLPILSNDFIFDYEKTPRKDLSNHGYLIDRFGGGKLIEAVGNLQDKDMLITSLIMVSSEEWGKKDIDFYLVDFTSEEKLMKTKYLGYAQFRDNEKLKLADINVLEKGENKTLYVRQVNPIGGKTINTRGFRIYGDHIIEF